MTLGRTSVHTFIFYVVSECPTNNNSIRNSIDEPRGASMVESTPNSRSLRWMGNVIVFRAISWSGGERRWSECRLRLLARSVRFTELDCYRRRGIRAGCRDDSVVTDIARRVRLAVKSDWCWLHSCWYGL